MRAVGQNKRCSACREWKHIDEFGKNNTKVDGRAVACRLCSNARHAEGNRRRRAADPVGEREKHHRWKYGIPKPKLPEAEAPTPAQESYLKNNDYYHFVEEKLAELTGMTVNKLREEYR